MARMEILGNQFTKPHWLADWSIGDQRMSPFGGKLDRASFNNYYGVDVQMAGAAIAGATSLTVAAIALPLPSVNLLSSTGVRIIPQGSIIIFDNTTGKMARLSADAHQGDTTLTVYPIPVALSGTEDTKWDAYNIIFVPSGILVGRPVWGTGLWEPGLPLSHAELALTFYDTPNLIEQNNCEFLRPNMGTTIKVNYLPQYSLMTADPGIVNPSVAPSLSVAGTDGTIPVGTYYVGYSYGNAYGETVISPLASIAVGSTNHITVADLGAFPTNATYAKFYVSPAPNVVGVQLESVQAAHGAINLLLPGSGEGPHMTLNNTQSGFGQQLTWLGNHYNLIQGVN
jgi:hypothetical protein